jgi:hypothetical protein
MNRCPYCGYPAYAYALECAKCHFPLTRGGTLYSPAKTPWIGAERALEIRRKALAVLALGLLLKVYWGGYGPWPVISPPALDHLRSWLEPLFTEGGAAAYAAGWVLRFF